ncbi:MAG TPA: hypothetical protein VN699_22275 [Pirellulales bacterium]|nr:hypothetical protein [Pirellulales bacterium]
MQDAGLSFLASQLGYQLPALLVYLVGALAVAFMRRARAPSLLALAGTAVLLISAVAASAFQAYLLHLQQAGGRDDETRQLMQAVGIAASCIRAGGLALLVAAIFVGRGAAAQTEPDIFEPNS